MLMSASTIIEKSVTLYKQNALLFLKYSALYLIPALAAASIMSLANTQFIVNNFSLTYLQIFSFWTLRFIFSTTLGLWISIILLHVVIDTYLGKPIRPLKEVLGWSAKHIFPALIASIVGGFFIFLGALLLVIPGFIISIYITFYLCEIVTDEKKAIQSLQDSVELVKGRWFDVLWRLFVPGIFFFLIITLAELVLTFPFSFSDVLVAQAISGLITLCITVLTTPFIAGAFAILYVELKKTKGQVLEQNSLDQ